MATGSTDQKRKPRAKNQARSVRPIHAVTMRELGKLTADQVAEFDHPVPVTSNGKPVAWPAR